MSPIPWTTILTHGPAIVASARRLLATTDAKDARERHAALDLRLEELQRASAESARLVHDIAEQVQALTMAQQEAARRGRIAITLAVAALLVAIGAAILVLVR
jgi:CHASE3 domain sensor protein